MPPIDPRLLPFDEIPTDPPALPTASSWEPAAYWWLAFLIALGLTAIVDVYLWRTHRRTISQWIAGKAHHFLWLRLLGAAGLLFLVWHWFLSARLFPRWPAPRRSS